LGGRVLREDKGKDKASSLDIYIAPLTIVNSGATYNPERGCSKPLSYQPSGLGERRVLPPAGSGAEPGRHMVVLHFKSFSLTLY